MNINFFDTETTGFEDHDRILQFAALTERDDTGDEEDCMLLCKPPVPISIDAMSVHHITEKMVAVEVPFMEMSQYPKIKELFESEDSVCIAHNAQFDVKMIAKENIVPKNVICTYKVIRHLDPEGEIPKYKLQYLRYFYGMDIQAEAHDAMGDVLVLKELFKILVDKMMRQEPMMFSEPTTVEHCIKKMIEISKYPVKIPKFTFGKYNGLKISFVAQSDLGYLRWLHNAESQKPDKDADMLYTLEQYI